MGEARRRAESAPATRRAELGPVLEALDALLTYERGHTVAMWEGNRPRAERYRAERDRRRAALEVELKRLVAEGG